MDLSKIYELFISDDTILTLTQLAIKVGFKPKSIQYVQMCKNLYTEYGMDHIKKISYKRMSVNRLKIRNSKPVKYSEQTKQKMSQSQLESWANSSDERRAISANNMKNNGIMCTTPSARKKAIETRRNNGWPGITDYMRDAISKASSNRVFSAESRMKMSKSAIARGRTLPPDFKHSDETKRMLSEKTLQQWKDGKCVVSYHSKGEIELLTMIQDIYPDTIGSYFIDGREYDIYIPYKKMVVEYHGTYFHMDPRKYNEDYFDKCRNCYAVDIWKKDLLKDTIAKNAGLTYHVVWQLDWESCDKNTIITELLT